MKFSAAREALLKPLQAVIGVVERRQTMPILANVLVIAKDGEVSITATDLEVELVASIDVNVDAPGATSANLRSLGHTKCARPIFPLDEGVEFQAVADVFQRNR